MADLIDMNWREAPEWATHIVGWYGEDDCCFWAEKKDGRYFCEKGRQDGYCGTLPAYSVSFAMATKHDKFGWAVKARRPRAASVNGEGEKQ